MKMNELIYKKRQGKALSQEEIDFIISGVTAEKIPDYQTSALLMAIFFQKMNKEETFALANAMKNSGDTIDLSSIKGIKVDKHSTGGVGDKTTLVVGPIAAAAGVPIAKMSGRGLGFTGGTVDKMESIEGFQTSLESEEFLNQVNDIGLAVIGQTGHIAPADKKLYALRDVTATVDNMSLISSSIMSKKLAAGSDAIVLDVKCGNGAFMENEADATTLANLMCDIGNAAGKKTISVITDMSRPLGRAIGNSNEVIEAIETLKGKGPEDITELALVLGGIMIVLGEKANTPEEGYNIAKQMIQSGKALNKLEQFIERQGGNKEVINDYNLFPSAKSFKEITATEDGFVSSIDARTIGLASQKSGAGRGTKEEIIDLGAGIYLNKQVGEAVTKGQVIATIYSNSEEKLKDAYETAKAAFVVKSSKPTKIELIKKIIGFEQE